MKHPLYLFLLLILVSCGQSSQPANEIVQKDVTAENVERLIYRLDMRIDSSRVAFDTFIASGMFSNDFEKCKERMQREHELIDMTVSYDTYEYSENTVEEMRYAGVLLTLMSYKAVALDIGEMNRTGVIPRSVEGRKVIHKVTTKIEELTDSYEEEKLRIMTEYNLN
ncbi:MAG: hypothetical protein QNK23_11750 [Crocinitomicaceae bacterium]|nr:hypothetical protein [Crocinitomicaceae bacterium]